MNEAVMSGALEQPEQLSRAERLHLTWALVWPCALFSLAYGVLRGLGPSGSGRSASEGVSSASYILTAPSGGMLPTVVRYSWTVRSRRRS